jgi:hypothetical protein
MTTDGPLFGRRLPLLQLLADEKKTVLTLALTAFGQGLDHFHKMLTLAARPRRVCCAGYRLAAIFVY